MFSLAVQFGPEYRNQANSKQCYALPLSSQPHHPQSNTQTSQWFRSQDCQEIVEELWRILRRSNREEINNATQHLMNQVVAFSFAEDIVDNDSGIGA
jgi:hypothetical protein